MLVSGRPEGRLGELGVLNLSYLSSALGGGGGIGETAYNHDQAITSDEWVIVHNLNILYPVVHVFDSTGNLIEAEVENIGLNTTTIRLANSITGSARLVGSGYLHLQPTPSSNWTVVHSFAQPGCSVIYDDVDKIAIAQIPLATPQTSISLTRSISGASRILPGVGVVLQPIPSDTWNIVHSLGFRPIVQAYNNSNQEVEVSVSHPSVNTTILSFLTPVAGVARFN